MGIKNQEAPKSIDFQTPDSPTVKSVLPLSLCPAITEMNVALSSPLSANTLVAVDHVNLQTLLLLKQYSAALSLIKTGFA